MSSNALNSQREMKAASLAHSPHHNPPSLVHDLSHQSRRLGSPHMVSSPRRVFRADILEELGQMQRMIGLANQLADVTPDLAASDGDGCSTRWTADSMQLVRFNPKQFRRNF